MEGSKDQSSSQGQLLPAGSAGLLASSFDLQVEDVQADAKLVVQWQGSNDDLLFWLATRHSFGAGTAARYLRGLRVALSARPEPP